MICQTRTENPMIKCLLLSWIRITGIANYCMQVCQSVCCDIIQAHCYVNTTTAVLPQRLHCAAQHVVDIVAQRPCCSQQERGTALTAFLSVDSDNHSKPVRPMHTDASNGDNHSKRVRPMHTNASVTLHVSTMWHLSHITLMLVMLYGNYKC